MLNPRNLDEFTRRIQRMIPAGADVLGSEFREALREALMALFDRLHLVTREEFEVQVALLERAEAKLAALETTLETLEARAADPLVTLEDPPAQP